jgi:hypothetical protein
MQFSLNLIKIIISNKTAIVLTTFQKPLQYTSSFPLFIEYSSIKTTMFLVIFIIKKNVFGHFIFINHRVDPLILKYLILRKILSVN